jgi:hypothetical protein
MPFEHFGHFVKRNRFELAVLDPEHPAETGAADAGGVRQHGLEHELKVAWRTADDLQYLRGRGLLLECLGKLARARLLGLEQSNVFDCDHRLVGESCDKLNLFVRVRFNFRTRQRDHADWHPLAKQRN